MYLIRKNDAISFLVKIENEVFEEKIKTYRTNITFFFIGSY